MIQLENVSKRFGGLTAVHNCSFSIPTGQITGVIGPNGAGKTTVFNMIAGLLQPSSGQIFLDGEDITSLPAHKRQSKGLYRTFQLAHEFSRMTVVENLMVAADSSIGENVFNAIFRPSIFQKQEHAAYDKAMETLRFLEIEKLQDELAGNLSGGQKKLLELGRTLMQTPKVILLDEIGAGVNRSLLSKIAVKIQQLNDDFGYTFCLIEHDLDYVSRLCDEVVVLAQATVLTTGTIEKIKRDERVVEAYFGGGKYEGAHA
ncbi:MULTISPECIES: ABC transporter ATP-binding protein [unclassified Pseudovibrio]|uniref:ABC transporter ATP-binding protein n=1 Tax=unclassified Pseudovibrio TaxID=2627060 RepID=UPI0007AEAB81|nr:MULTISPECIES: ABC transporter ATP-binding protein [unclassified Pseudovibrio]KZL24424.1 Lipopolysaccharide export system ATP-binding protein LptB [Pseudovibrio sp. Ad37]KZL27443.1 Lipopolysaccharide export system ATP-binding protein LptB [Pseudovibrio sp. WM33]